MNRTELEAILPHRDGMLLLDEAALDGETARGKLRIRGDEWFLQGHFPGNPVVPGVILCEIMAQTSCALFKDGIPEGMLPMYTGINNARFKSPVRPGDTLETECRITKARPPFYFAEGKLTVDGRLCAKAEFSFAFTGV